jgi:hypothetical protein
MKIATITRTKTTAAIAITLLMISAFMVLANVTVQAQDDEDVPHGYWGGGGGYGSLPLPSDVTPDVSYDTIAHISFRPSPIGVGQLMLVNVWMQPPIHVSRYMTGYTVTITKPDGTEIIIGPMSSYLGDTTTWFEYVFYEVGTWQIQFDFPGGYFPAGNYTVPEGSYYAGRELEAPLSVYYKPSSDGPYDFVVQDEQMLSWPPSPLPTDYWTRPALPNNREWWPILGNYPSTGVVAGVGRSVTLDDWPANTNKYMSNYDFIPYVQGPKSAHIVWKRQDDVGGLIGGTMGTASYFNRAATPQIVFAGRAYQTVTKVFNGVRQSVWQCYDIRTGEIYWEQTGIAHAPDSILYSEREMTVVPGEESSTLSVRTELMYVGGGRLITYDPWDGRVSMNFSIAPLSSATYYASYDWPYFLSVQNLGGGNYRLINWTITGDQRGFSLSNFRLDVISNVSFPFSRYNVADYEAMIGVSTQSITPSSVGVSYGYRIMGVSLKTGQLLWNVTTDFTKGTEGFFSGSTAVADHGKFAVRLNDGHWHCWSLYTGQKQWVGELSSWPWGTFGCYGVSSYGGYILSNQYDACVAYDWDDGSVAWEYNAHTPVAFETPYYDEDHLGTYPYFTGTLRIADGVVYTQNQEHSEGEPYVRGYRLHAFNASTGEGIWSLPFTGGGRPAVADGYLTTANYYDCYMYTFGKGKSETTVSGPLTAVPLGTSMMITGSVLDMSPAQPGTPCVSKDSMSTQMSYLHMQYPIDGILHDEVISGVPVALTAIGEDGDFVDLGTVTTDGYHGTFGKAWTPDKEGTYKIIASFESDDSYGSSSASAYVIVGPAPSPAGPIEPEPTEPTEPAEAPFITTEVAIIAVVAVAAVIGIVAFWALRKRK